MLHYAGLVSFCFLPALAFFIPRSRWRSFALALGAASLPILAWSPTILGSPEQSMGWVDTAAGPGRPGLATIQVLAPAGPFPALFENPDSPIAPWLSVSILMSLAGVAIAGSLLRNTGVAEDSVAIGDEARLGFGVLPFVWSVACGAGRVARVFCGPHRSMVWPLVVAMVSLLFWRLPAPAEWTAAGVYALVGG